MEFFFYLHFFIFLNDSYSLGAHKTLCCPPNAATTTFLSCSCLPVSRVGNRQFEYGKKKLEFFFLPKFAIFLNASYSLGAHNRTLCCPPALPPPLSSPAAVCPSAGSALGSRRHCLERAGCWCPCRNRTRHLMGRCSSHHILDLSNHHY